LSPSYQRFAGALLVDCGAAALLRFARISRLSHIGAREVPVRPCPNPFCDFAADQAPATAPEDIPLHYA
jgi:hypothetical protein